MRPVVRVRGVAADTDALLMGRLCAQVEGYNLHAATGLRPTTKTDWSEWSATWRGLPSRPIAWPGCKTRLELRLKRPWRDGTIHIIMSPLQFMQRLAPHGCHARGCI